MKNQKGFIPIVLAIVISVIAVAMVGVGVYFKVASDKQAEKANTNQVATNTNTGTNVNTAVNTNIATNMNAAVNTNATNQNSNTNTATNVNTNANTNTATNTNTASSPYSSAGCPTWPTYTDVEYSWTARYPCNWTAVRTYEASGEDMFDYPTRYVVFKDPTNHYRLFVGIIREGDAGSTINRTGVGAGEFVNQTAIQVAGVSVPVRNLVYQNKVKEVFFYTSGAIDLGNYLLTSTFDEEQVGLNYDTIQLAGTDELAKAKIILQSIDLP